MIEPPTPMLSLLPRATPILIAYAASIDAFSHADMLRYAAALPRHATSPVRLHATILIFLRFAAADADMLRYAAVDGCRAMLLFDADAFRWRAMLFIFTLHAGHYVPPAADARHACYVI